MILFTEETNNSVATLTTSTQSTTSDTSNKYNSVDKSKFVPKGVASDPKHNLMRPQLIHQAGTGV